MCRSQKKKEHFKNQRRRKMNRKIQYKTITKRGDPISEKELNELGEWGWELVSAMEYENEDVAYYFHYIFKMKDE